ncbi:MAG: YggT family protein [Candidatus Rifleibacteriota bacterium]
MIVLIINLIRLLQLVIFVRVLLTWIMPGRLPEPLQKIADPIDRLLKVFQVLIPVGPGFIDIGPMLCLLLLEVIQRVLISAFYSGAALF